MTEALRDALGQIAGKNDLSGVSDNDMASAACNALHECELIARAALAATPAVGGHMQRSKLDDASNACLELCSRHGFATGHGDTVADMIREIDGQITTPAVGGERERIATIIDPVAAYHHAAANTANYKAAYEKADAILAAQPASPLRGREEIAAAMYAIEYDSTTYEFSNAHEATRAILLKMADAALSASPPEQPAALNGETKA